MPNLEHLGNLACAKAEACYNQVKAAIDVRINQISNPICPFFNCIDTNVTFVSELDEKVILQNLTHKINMITTLNNRYLFPELPYSKP